MQRTLASTAALLAWRCAASPALPRSRAPTCLPIPPPAEVPLRKAVAGARVGLLPGRGFVVNPTVEEQVCSA